MSSAITKRDEGEIMERVIAVGDLSKLTPGERSRYYGEVCHSLGLNPLTRPFEYITLNSKLTLYARKDATDQLRRINGVSIQIVSRERVDDVYVVTARATTKEGRADESIGVVNLGTLKGDLLANALMKAETKAKRRVTLSICGLGWLDESETETIHDARPAEVAPDGEIIETVALLSQAQLESIGKLWLQLESADFFKNRKAIQEHLLKETGKSSRNDLTVQEAENYIALLDERLAHIEADQKAKEDEIY